MTAEADAQERVKLLEERRKASEGVLWQLPAVSLAAQAFLLAAGLNPAAEDWARIIAGSLGFFSVILTAAVLTFQGLRLSILVRSVDQALGTQLDERILAKELRGIHRLKRYQKKMLRVPDPYISWSLLLFCFLVADVYVFGRGAGVVG